MSDTSKSSHNKRRLREIDDTIENLTHAVQNLKDFMLKSEFESSIMTAKLKREKIKALTAVAKSQVILAEMDVLIAECDLYSDLEMLKNNKRIKMDHNGGKSNHNESSKIRHSTPLTSTMNSESMKSSQVQNKSKSKSKKSSKKNDELDNTVLIDRIKTETVSETLEITTLNVPNESVNNIAKSDSEISITSSINAEFNMPYTNIDTLDNAKTTHKSGTNTKPKKKYSKTNVEEQNQSSITTKTVAEINKTISPTPHNAKDANDSQIVTTHNNNKFKNRQESKDNTKTDVDTCTYVPLRHNLPMIISQPKYMQQSIASTTVMSPCLYVNTLSSQANMYQNQTPICNLVYQTPSMGVMNNTQNLHHCGKKD